MLREHDVLQRAGLQLRNDYFTSAIMPTDPGHVQDQAHRADHSHNRSHFWNVFSSWGITTL